MIKLIDRSLSGTEILDPMVSINVPPYMERWAAYSDTTPFVSEKPMLAIF